MHFSHRFHPLVGAGQKVKPRDTARPTCTKFEAWTWLNIEAWTWQTIPGEGGNYVTLDAGLSVETIPDIAVEWNWPAATARKFIADLAEEKLITDGLADLLLKRVSVPRSNNHRRDTLPRRVRAVVLAKTSGKCVYCGVTLVVESGSPHSFQPDHVLPVKLGGSDDIANLIPSCATCNAKKHAKTLVRFAGAQP